MAKGQKRNSREAKKPKQLRAQTAAVTSPLSAARTQDALPPAKKIQSNSR